MISTDTQFAGAVVVTPPAVGLCSGVADQVVRTRSDAPEIGTGLPVAGTTTGAFLGASLSVPTTALPWAAVTGVPTERTSSTPGDLPPEDPLSQ